MNFSDKLGVYRVGDLKVYSKLEAIELHVKTGIHPHWDFNDAIFSCYDWTKEPKISIQELYKKRAIQLREEYDYLILNYSSGADSQTILDTFVDNEILLDEVFSFVNSQGSNNTEDLHNFEIFNHAIPYMEKLNTIQSWPYHRVIDVTETIIDYFKSKISKDWIYAVNMLWGPFQCGLTQTILSVPKWQKLIDEGKKVCVIYGTDKPRIIHEDGKFAVRFVDIVGFTGCTPDTSGKLPYSTEYFYWTPALPEIVIKQAHLIKNYLNSGNIKKLPNVTKTKTDLAYKVVDDEKYWLNFVGLHDIIYPQWQKHNRLNQTKPLGNMYSLTTKSGGSEKEQWFYKSNQTEDFWKYWEMGYAYLCSTIPNYWKNDPYDISKGIKGSVSKNYFLE